jgi:hypothetical protein
VLLGALAIAALGDPSAGAPSLRSPVAAEPESGGERIRRLLSPEEAFTTPTLDPLQLELGGIVGLEPAGSGGQATITLPSGGRVTNGVTVRTPTTGRKLPASPLPSRRSPGWSPRASPGRCP